MGLDGPDSDATNKATALMQPEKDEDTKNLIPLVAPPSRSRSAGYGGTSERLTIEQVKSLLSLYTTGDLTILSSHPLPVENEPEILVIAEHRTDPTASNGSALVKDISRRPVHLQYVLKCWKAETSDANDRKWAAISRSMTKVGERIPWFEGSPVPTLNRASTDSVHLPICDIGGSLGRVHSLLLEFVEGPTLAEVGRGAASEAVLPDLGRKLAQIDITLATLDEPDLRRESEYDLRHYKRILGTQRDLMGRDEASLARSFLLRFERHTEPWLDRLKISLIHNAVSPANVLVHQQPNEPPNAVKAIKGWDNMTYSWTVADLAITMAHAILNHENSDPLNTAGLIARGYHEIRPLDAIECRVLFGLVTLRVFASAVIDSGSQELSPPEKSLQTSLEQILRVLPKLQYYTPEFAEAYFRHVVGFDPQPVRTSVIKWLECHHELTAFPVEIRGVRIGSKPGRVTAVDLEPGSLDFVGDPLEDTESRISKLVADTLLNSTAEVAIGRYLEYRIPERAQLAPNGSWEEEKATLQLGIDIFTEPGASVVAALNGRIHYAGQMAKTSGLGNVVILRHETYDDARHEFFTLHYFLKAEVLETLEPGKKIERGTPFGRVADRDENGGLTPRLRFQVATDLLGCPASFPLACRHSKRMVWQHIVIDPNLVLGIPPTMIKALPPSKSETLQARQRATGKNVSLFYDSPLKVVRGWQQLLFDETGRVYLDTFNNVCHVGHSNPSVAAAAERQMKVLTTNTRYLHDNLNEYSALLASTMPDGLQVCYFLNSATEANELAMTLARAVTKREDVIVLGNAYHGHTRMLIDMSPYKHDGPGGDGPPGWVHVAPVPDTYRGQYKDAETAGPEYAAQVGRMIDEMATSGQDICAFIAESAPSCGGQTILPKGYLSQVYSLVRKAGGLCIADEVQTGFGRLGTKFYGFETQEAMPDIVVLGKPIGNGHPLAAVVTSSAIADAFAATGMEFFSTFGGNPVSCAVGLAVLQELEGKDMQANALRVGEYILNGLRELQKMFPSIIGDIRGSGLFIGAEIVKPNTTEPHKLAAQYVVNRVKELGVLIGSDGPNKNVLKLRGPMCLTMDDGQVLLRALRIAFEEYPKK